MAVGLAMAFVKGAGDGVDRLRREGRRADWNAEFVGLAHVAGIDRAFEAAAFGLDAGELSDIVKDS